MIKSILIAALALSAGYKHIITYSCPICHKVQEYQEISFSQHYCTGDDIKVHHKQRMNKVAERGVVK